MTARNLVPSLRSIAVFGALLFASTACSDDPSSPDAAYATDTGFSAAALCTWVEHADNPLIEPPPKQPMIADPTIVPPRDAPDGLWHLYAHSLLGIHHYSSPQGIVWAEVSLEFTPGAVRPFVFKDGDRYALLFERFHELSASEIHISTSDDLKTWSEARSIVVPELAWEHEGQSTIGNPYLTFRDGEYWLYYSAGGVVLDDAGFSEPRYIGVATASAIGGPYSKRDEPLMGPDAGNAYRNLGAGSMKLLDDRYSGRLVALQNGIYKDSEGKSRSAIMVLASDDGTSWEEVCPAPILEPDDSGWSGAFVYAFDTVRVGNELRVYDNARDGWKGAKERIGMATVNLEAGAPAD